MIITCTPLQVQEESESVLHRPSDEVDQISLAVPPSDHQVRDHRCATVRRIAVSSAKFSRKVTYINRLSELAEHVHLDNIRIPTEVKK